jgi:GTP-binding protein
MPPKPELYPIADAAFLYAIAVGSSAPENETPEIAFAGRSNVGKSSLMNKLTNRRNLVRTSSTPGCTRQINLFEVRIAGGPVLRLVDLPGFGFAKRSKGERVQWGELIENYLTTRRALKTVVLLVDARREFEDEERMLIDFLASARQTMPVQLLGVATKIDKVNRSQAASVVAAMRKHSGLQVFPFSALSGEGRDQLWRAILATLQPADAPSR